MPLLNRRKMTSSKSGASIEPITGGIGYVAIGFNSGTNNSTTSTIKQEIHGNCTPYFEYAVITGNSNTPTDADFQYWNPEEAITIKYNNSTTTRERFYLRGRNLNGISTSTSNYVRISITVSNSRYMFMSGNIMHLIDATQNRTTIPCNYCFYKMFSSNTKLQSILNLTFPATGLTSYCYSNMFNGDTQLYNQPTAGLPATTMKAYCYDHMFYGCAKVTAPCSLPGTTLAESCYAYMFSHTGLTSLPTLSATTLENNCYNSMFSACNSLTSMPTNYLQSTNLATGCYSDMFFNCSTLANCCNLPATNLKDQCYFDMFAYTAITSAPTLAATTMKPECYRGMFSGCTGLTTSPVLPGTTLASSCYREMFKGCSNLSYITYLHPSIAPNATYCDDWVSGVPTGSGHTFETATGKTWTNSFGVDAIPTGWTVVERMP